MNGEVIKEFLVGLGFSVDGNSLAKFNKAIESATLKVATMYTAIQAAAAAIFYGISKISEGFEQMGYEFRLIAPTINKVLLLRRALLESYQAAGINILKAVQQSVLFNFSLTKTKYALEAIYKSVGLKFLPLLTKQMDIFRSQIYKNMPKIQAALTSFVKVVLKAFEATIQLGSRLWSVLGRIFDFFVALDKATNGWSTTILALVTAWKYLNLAFLATPLGALITGLVALLALYDDFKTQQEGGKSLFDWKKGGLKDLLDILSEAKIIVMDMWTALKNLAHGDFTGLKAALSKLGDDFILIGEKIGEGFIRAVKGNLGGLLRSLVIGGDDGEKELKNVYKQINPFTNPDNFAIPYHPTSGGGMLDLKSQTTINVQGSADPNATATAVASQQTGVNRGLVRNMQTVVA